MSRHRRRHEHSRRHERHERPHEVDPTVAPLGDLVAQVWSSERLTREQQRRHLRRVRGGGEIGEIGEIGEVEGRLANTAGPSSLSPISPISPTFQLAAAVLAFVAVATVLVLVFRDPAGTPVPPVVTVRPYGTPEGWAYGGAQLPGGGQIAFTRLVGGKAQIAVINADGSGLRTLSDGSWDQSSPTWSPDGRQLAFTGIRDGMPQVYVMPAEGGIPEQRTIYRDSLNPAWSPDGARIAYLSNQDHKLGVYVMDADGTHQPALSGALALEGVEFPRWSPDGARLAFVTGGALYVVDAGGGEPRRLAGDAAAGTWPEWSPDGRWLAFVSERDGNADIVLVDPDDSANQRRLTATSDDELAPAWSPDGTRIAYSFQPAGALPGTEVYLHVMQADGSGQQRLVPEVRSAAVIAAAWAPDGARLAFAAQPFGTSMNTLFIVNADGSGLMNMPVDLPDLSRPVWRPLWWPSANNAATPDEPRLTLEPARGDCETPVVVRGERFAPGTSVTLYGAPAGDGSFGQLGQPVTVDAEGRFSAPVDPGGALACADDTPAAGATFHIGAATDVTEREGAYLAALLAAATYTFGEPPPTPALPDASPVAH